MTEKVNRTGAALLRDAFPANQISKLPKQMKRDDQDRGKCERGSRYSADGHYCGGYHARSIHLDYVGHAALTDRLLDADPAWSWEPACREVDPQVLAAACASGNPEIVRMVIENGAPVLDRDGGMWMRLTVDGITRLGYGDAGRKSGPDATKERIGDGLRNAAMRFGAALDLWHKGDLHDDAEPESTPPPSGNGRARRTATVAVPAPEPVVPEPSAPDDPDWSALDVQRFEELIDGAGTATELNGIAADIASSSISGEARDALRAKFSARVKAVTA